MIDAIRQYLESKGFRCGPKDPVFDRFLVGWTSVALYDDNIEVSWWSYKENWRRVDELELNNPDTFEKLEDILYESMKDRD